MFEGSKTAIPRKTGGRFFFGWRGRRVWWVSGGH
jgi:hypothetical protein